MLGGTSLAGGRGGLIGVVFGAFSIYLLQNLLANFQVNPAWLQIVYGAILIAAVVIQGALIPETGTGGLKPVRMPVLHRSRRRVSSGGALRSGAAVAARRGADGAAAARRGRRHPGGSPRPGGRSCASSSGSRSSSCSRSRPCSIYGAITLPGLDSWISIRSILVLAALVGLASCGQTLLILMGGFDLGVSGFIVAGGLTVTALKVKYGLDFGTALALALIAAAVLGGFAGYICHRFRINPLVVTLAMGSIVDRPREGADRRADQRLPAAVADQPGGAGDQDLRGGDPAVGRDLGLVVIVCSRSSCTAPAWDATCSPPGANPRAADRALINTRRVWVAAFAFSAVTSALVGVLIGGFGGVVADNGGDTYLFQSVVAVIVGGTVFGGPGDYTRTSIGALFLTVLVTVLIGHGASPAAQQIVYGGDHPRRRRHLRAGEEAARPRLNGAPTQVSRKCARSQVRHIFKGEEQMRDKAKRLRRPSSRRMIVGAASVAALAVVAATAFAIGVKPTGAGAVKTGTNCGDTVSVGPTNKNGVYASMPKSLQDIYGSYPDKLVASPWATTKIKAKPPWKIGYITIGISNPYQNDVLTQLKKEFALAKAKGLVTGSLAAQHPAEPGAVDA